MPNSDSIAILDLQRGGEVGERLRTYLGTLFPAMTIRRYPVPHGLPDRIQDWPDAGSYIILASHRDISRVEESVFQYNLRNISRARRVALITDAPSSTLMYNPRVAVWSLGAFEEEGWKRVAKDIAVRLSSLAFEPVGRMLEEGEDISSNQLLFLRVSGLGFSERTQRALRVENIIFVGDLVQHTEAELLRLPDFGRKSLNEVKETLVGLGLRLGLDVPGWPPPDIEEVLARAEAVLVLSRIEQAKLGARFEPRQDRFEIDPTGDDDDWRAAQQPVVRQLHDEVQRKAERFFEVAKRVDNQIGWQGIGAYCHRLVVLLSRPTDDIPDVIGTLYSAALELGSYLEMDRSIARGEDGFASPLEPEVRRPLEDLIKTMAPWVRSFPTARAMDDEAGQFLTRDALLDPAAEAISIAQKVALLGDTDSEAIGALIAAAKRGEVQGIKAEQRSVLSVRNLITVSAGILGTIAIGAVGSAVATQSVLAQKAAVFFLQAEPPVLRLIASLPEDVRLAMELILSDLQKNPPALPKPPMVADAAEGGASKRRRL